MDRIASAQYHRDRILALAAEVEAKRAAFETRSQQRDSSPRQGASTHVGLSWSPREMAYELDAFLAALRSAIDFIANVFAIYLQGFGSVRSITTLLKQLDQPSEPIWLLLKKWKPWIEYVKNYRDKYVHYRTLRGTVGIVVRTKDGVTASAVRPYVIPQDVGKDVPDTRGARALEHEIPAGIDENRSQLSITDDSGTETSLHLEYRPAPGYVTPGAFTAEHLEQLRHFFSDAIAFVTGRDFAPMIVPHGKRSVPK